MQQAKWTKENGQWAIITSDPCDQGEAVMVYRRDGSSQKKYIGNKIGYKYGKYVYSIGAYNSAPKQTRYIAPNQGKKRCDCGAWADQNAGMCFICGEDFMW